MNNRMCWIVLACLFVLGALAACGEERSGQEILKALPSENVNTGIKADKVLARFEVPIHVGGLSAQAIEPSNWRRIMAEELSASWVPSGNACDLTPGSIEIGTLNITFATDESCDTVTLTADTPAVTGQTDGSYSLQTSGGITEEWDCTDPQECDDLTTPTVYSGAYYATCSSVPAQEYEGTITITASGTNCSVATFTQVTSP